MHHKSLLFLWGGLFGLCAALGFLPTEGIWKLLCTGLSIVHFLPPTILLYRAGEEKDRSTIRLVRNLSCLSLLLTMLLLVGNFLTVGAGQVLGDLLYYMLVVISSPMVCSGYWVLSLFLWACLLMGSLQLLRKQ